MNFIFPAAGRGVRFRNVGITTPKPLILVENIPLLVWAIGNFEINSSDKVWIIIQKNDQIEEFIHTNFPKLYKQCNFIVLKEITSGPATTVSMALNNVNDYEPILIANTDQYVFKNLSDFTKSVDDSKSQGTIMTMEAGGNQWSYVSRGQDNAVERVVEKQQISDEATVGIYGFKESRFFKDAYANMRANENTVNGEYYVAPSYNYLIKCGLTVSTFHIGKYGDDITGTGTPEDLNQFAKDFRVKNLAVGINNRFK